MLYIGTGQKKEQCSLTTRTVYSEGIPAMERIVSHDGHRGCLWRRIDSALSGKVHVPDSYADTFLVKMLYEGRAGISRPDIKNLPALL